MPVLKISIKDKGFNKVIEIINKNKLSFSTRNGSILIDASNPKNNNALAKIMEVQELEDYLLTKI
jgi:5'(3')-deoxyribonucleotidase